MPPTKPSPSTDESLKWVVPFYFTSGAVISLTPQKKGQHSFPIAGGLLKGVPCSARPNLPCHGAFVYCFRWRRVPEKSSRVRARSFSARARGRSLKDDGPRKTCRFWFQGPPAQGSRSLGGSRAPPHGVVEKAAAKEVVEEAFVKEGVASPGGRRRSRGSGEARVPEGTPGHPAGRPGESALSW